MHRILSFIVALVVLLPTTAPAQTLAEILTQRAEELAAGKSAALKDIAADVTATREPQTRAVLEAWIDGRLHYRCGICVRKGCG